MRNIRTAKGKKLDMSALAKQHENVRAVSNVSMNARGDRLDAKGNVVKTVRAIAQKQHEIEEPPTMAPISNPTKVEDAVKEAPAEQPVEDTISIVNQALKEREEDGTFYLEIEYDDGSMETRELTADEAAKFDGE
jgi:vacuolar-type H+-ATPase subunit E/Vma4